MLRAFILWWPLLAAVLLVQLGNGLQSTAIGLRMDSAGFSAFDIAVIMSGLYAGQVAGSLVSPRLIAGLGHVRYYTVVALLTGAAPAMFLIAPQAVIWSLTRFLLGFGLAGIFVVVESWMSDRTANADRARVFAVYIIVQLGGLLLAQSIVPPVAPDLVLTVTLVFLFCALSLAPVVLAPLERPEALPHASASFGVLWRASPAGMAGAAISGTVWAMVMSMSPVYAGRAGFDVDGVAIFVAAAVAGGIALQLPIGWLADMRDRRLVLGAITALATLAALVGAADISRPVAVAAIAVFGGMTFPIYSVAVSHVNDHVEPRHRVSASAAMILVFGVGSIFGPSAASAAMAALGPPGFFVALAAATGLLSGFVFYRMRVVARPQA